jgi:hypothetical protein
MRAVKSRGGLTHGRGMTESVRVMWVSSMHKCASVHAGLTSLISLEQSCDDVQHVEMGKSRTRRDCDDVTKMLTWFEAHNPFMSGDCRLHCLSSGIAAADSDRIDCDSAVEVG